MNRVGTGKLREQNDKKIISLLAQYHQVSKKELAQYSGLTVATVGTILNDFLGKQIVIETDLVQALMGRPAKKYQLNSDFYHSLGVFIQHKLNKNYLVWQVFDALSELVESKKKELELVDSKLIVNLIEEIVLADQYIKVIGLGIPAVISNDVIIECDLPELKNTNFKDEIEKRTKIMTLVKNDMNYTAYGYYKSLNKLVDVCYMTFQSNNGPGCGSVINGNILEGKNSIAGEILYLPFFKYLKLKEFNYLLENVALSICCVASIINPSVIVITGKKVEAYELDEITNICKEYIPSEFMPEIIYCQEYEDDYMLGIKEVMLSSYIESLY